MQNLSNLKSEICIVIKMREIFKRPIIIAIAQWPFPTL